MKLSEFFKPAVPTPEPVSAEASPEPLEEPQGTSTVTPSGIEIAYEWAPRRLYRLRGTGIECAFTDPSRTQIASYKTDQWREVPSVTTVLSVLDKSGALTWWGMKVGVEGVLSLHDQGILSSFGGGVCRLDEMKTVDTDAVVSLLTEHKLTVNHVKDKAADRGVNVHNALNGWAVGEMISASAYPESERGYVQGLYDFCEAVTDNLSATPETELMVGSLQHQYAGRFDLVLTLSKPVEVVTRCYEKRKPKIEEIPAGRYLLDLKTSKRVYDTHHLQLEAYEAAAVECGYAPTDYRGVVHVTANGKYELCLNKDWTLEDFLAVLRCYRVINEHKVIAELRELDAKEVA